MTKYMDPKLESVILDYSYRHASMDKTWGLFAFKS